MKAYPGESEGWIVATLENGHPVTALVIHNDDAGALKHHGTQTKIKRRRG